MVHLTIPLMARQMGVTPQRLGYYIRSRRLTPIATVGAIKIFDAAAFAQLREIVTAAETRRRQLHPVEVTNQ